MSASDTTVEILKDIRDEIRGVRSEVHDSNQRLDGVHSEVQATNKHLGVVETTLLDLAEQQRFVVRYVRAISERDGTLEPRVSALQSRVGKLESK